jgi:hypothetical protein
MAIEFLGQEYGIIKVNKQINSCILENKHIPLIVGIVVAFGHQEE